MKVIIWHEKVVLFKYSDIKISKNICNSIKYLIEENFVVHLVLNI